MKYYWSIDGQNNELVARQLESLATEPWLITSKIFYNTTDNRVEVGTPTWYLQIAYVNDIYGMSNWKKAANVATTATTDFTSYTYNQANEPAWDVWSWVVSAPTIDWVTLSNWDRLLIKDAPTLYGNGLFYYDATSSSFKRTEDADNTPASWEIASSMVPIMDGTDNKGTVRRETHTTNRDLWGGNTDAEVEYTPFVIQVPTEDKFVKISAADTTEKYLIDAIDNIAATATWLVNLSQIQIVLQNPWANENIRFALDLSTYTGNISMTGNLSVGWTTLLHNLNFATWSTVNWDNTTNTGTQAFDSNYIANYDDSEINYNNGTEVNQDSTSVYNNSGTTNYDSTATTNHNGDTVNNTWVTENYDSTSVTNNNWNTINNDDTTENNTWVTENYDSTSVTNNNWNTINNDDTTENNTWVTENYDSTSVTNNNWNTIKPQKITHE